MTAHQPTSSTTPGYNCPPAGVFEPIKPTDAAEQFQVQKKQNKTKDHCVRAQTGFIPHVTQRNDPSAPSGSLFTNKNKAGRKYAQELLNSVTDHHGSEFSVSEAP